MAQERGTSFVIQEREGTCSDLGYEMEGRGYRDSGSIVAHYHYLANDKHRIMFEKAKTPSVRELKTLGELDTDWWFHHEKSKIFERFPEWNRFRKVVLFLTFGERNYIEPTLFPNNPELTWRPLITDCEDVVFDFAKNNPDVLVIYRMGHKEDNNAKFLNRVAEAGLQNIVPSDRGTPYCEVAVRADFIIGFQSTAMYEAMFTDKPIVQVFWHIPALLNQETDTLPMAELGGCKVARSKDQLALFLDQWVKNDPAAVVSESELAKRKYTRELMFHNADGKVAERFLIEIKSLLKIPQNAS